MLLPYIALGERFLHTLRIGIHAIYFIRVLVMACCVQSKTLNNFFHGSFTCCTVFQLVSLDVTDSAEHKLLIIF